VLQALVENGRGDTNATVARGGAYRHTRIRHTMDKTMIRLSSNYNIIFL